MSQQPSPPQSGSSRRSSSSSSGAAAAPSGCDIESVGPNGEVTWRRMSPAKKFNAYAEFPQFGKRGVDRLREAFQKFDADKDDYLNLRDLTLMMEQLKAPQTHLALKKLVREFAAEGEDRLNFRGFLCLFKKAAAGQLEGWDPLVAWYAEYIGVAEVNVDEVGVKGAKNFFEAKSAIHMAGDLVQAEAREEQRRKQAEEEAKRVAKEAFNAKRDQFKPKS